MRGDSDMSPFGIPPRLLAGPINRGNTGRWFPGLSAAGSRQPTTEHPVSHVGPERPMHGRLIPAKAR